MMMSPPTPAGGAAAAWASLPPPPALPDDAVVAPQVDVQVCEVVSQVCPLGQALHLIVLPHAVPEPQAQSTPQTGVLQHPIPA